MILRKMIVALFILSVVEVSRAGNVDDFMAQLSILDAPCNTNALQWTAPRSIQVGTDVLNLPCVRDNRGEYSFALEKDGDVIASCRVGRAETSRAAERRLCEILVFAVTIPIDDLAEGFSASRNDAGDLVLIDHSARGREGGDSRRCYRTKGNLYAVVKVHAESALHSAAEIANALLSTGVGTAH